MADPDHAALLRRYAEDGDEQAFAALVERFKGLVYSTALRRLDSHQLAEEAAQTVFAIVARKARALQSVTHLAAWLHRTATHVARGIARTEARHRRKMNALSENSKTAPPAEDADHWCAIHPHLDEALERLPERDRQLLMLRFYDGLNFREIAEKLGKTEAAAQRQSHRAVEKLAERLKRRGATGASAGLIGAGLATQFTAPAPAAVATSALSQSALAAAPSLGGSALLANTIYTMSQAKTLTIAVAVIAVSIVPLGLQRAAIVKERQTLVRLESELQSAGVAVGEAGSANGARGAVSALRSGRSGAGSAAAAGGRIVLADWLDEFEAFHAGGALDEVARATALLNSFKERGRAELSALLDEAVEMDLEDGELHSFVVMALHDKVGEVFPELALESALRLDINRFSERGYIIGNCLAGYAAADAAKAVDWFLAASENGTIVPADSTDNLAKSMMRDPITTTLFRELYSSESPETERLYAGLAPRDQRLALMEKMEDIADPEKREWLLAHAATIEDADQRRWTLGEFSRVVSVPAGLGDETLAFVHALGERGQLSPEHAAFLVVAAAKPYFHQSVARDVTLEDAFAWVAESSPPEFVERNMAAAREYHGRLDPKARKQGQ